MTTATKRHERIPRDFEVRPLKPGQQAEDRCTCGHCGLSWDDAIVTSYTPAPSARCPFEEFHVYEDEEQEISQEAARKLLEACRDALRVIDKCIPHEAKVPVPGISVQLRTAIAAATK